MNVNKENIKKWVEALESGEYKQTTGVLRDYDGYCCLGVACDLYLKEKSISWTKPSIDNSHYSIQHEGLNSADSETLLPSIATWLFNNDLLEWSGDPKIQGFFLTEWNDDKGKTFKEIAKLIREEYDV